MKYLFFLFTIIGSLFPANSQDYSFTILAGQATAIGTNDGFGTNALFNHPHGLCVDPSGNVYVADTFNANIRHISPLGMTTTISPLTNHAHIPGQSNGEPVSLYVDFAFTSPQGIAIDVNSNLYVSDQDTANRTTVYIMYASTACSILQDFAEGPFLALSGMAVDPNGNLYIADKGNSVVWKSDPLGDVTLLAGYPGQIGESNGIGTNAQLEYPYSVAIGQSNTIYVSEDYGIVTISQSNQVAKFYTNYQIPTPHAITVDSSGNIYAVSGSTGASNNLVKLAPDGTSTIVGFVPCIGPPAPGPVLTAGNISGMGLDAWNNIYLSDQLHSVILKGMPNYPVFFNGAMQTNNGQFYLQFSDGNFFGFYFPQDFPYVYHMDMGWEYFVDANDGQGSAYLYDYSTGHWWYTSPALFPYLYDFSLGAWLYYFPDASNPGHYTSNPRYFFNFGMGQIVEE